MNQKKKSNQEALLVCVLLLAGFLLRVFTTQCYYWDELVYLQHAEIISGKMNNYNEFDFRPPLTPLLIAGSYLIWHNPFMANLLVTALSTISIFLMYLVGREMFGKETALLSAFMLTFWPIHIYFSKQILVHTIAIFFGLLCLLFLKKAERIRRGCLFFLAGIFAALSILTRFTYLALLPIIVVNIFLFRKRYGFKFIFSLFFGLIIPLLPYLVWAKINRGAFFYTFKMASLLAYWSTSEPVLFYFNNFHLILSFTGILGVLFWIYFKLKNKMIPRNEIFLLFWIFFPMIYLTTMSHKEVRFLMITLVPIILLSALGFNDLFKKIENKRTAFSLLFIFLLAGFSIYNHYPYKRECSSDGETAAHWIMENTQKTDIIYAQENFPWLAYYTDRKIVLAPFDKNRFFDFNNKYMFSPGYYVYFEKQNTIPTYPNLDELRNDSRFRLVEKIKNNQTIYIYALVLS